MVTNIKLSCYRNAREKFIESVLKSIMRGIFILLIMGGIHSIAERAILIGIDGFLTSCMKDTPNLNYLREQGTSTLKARSTIEGVSGPGWSSILCGQEPIDTGVLDNDWKPFWKTKVRNPITPISGDDPFLCVFEAVKKGTNHKLRTSAYFNWDWLVHLSDDIGFVDESVYVEDENLDGDIEITDRTVKAINEKNFGFMFTYLGSLDNMGHAKKFCGPEYVEHITKIDALVGRILNALRQNNLIDSTVIVVTSDHGASPQTQTHGDDKDDNNLLVPFIVFGNGVKKGVEFESTVHIADASATILHGLGIDIPKEWRGKPAKEAFYTHMRDADLL